jgi:hypothetical protein
MAKRKKPRSTSLPRPRRADLAQPLLDAAVRSTEHPATIDVEPLLVALRLGALDDHLEEIATIVNDRIAVLNVIDEIVAASRLHVGSRVRIGHNLRPQYLHGRPAKIVAKDGDEWIVRLYEPVGRFTNADLRLHAIQLEPLGTPWIGTVPEPATRKREPWTPCTSLPSVPHPAYSPWGYL